MNHLGKTAAAALVILLAGCSQQNSKVKAQREEDYKQLHQELEKERAMDAYRNSPAYKAKVAKQMQERYGNMSKALQDLRIP